MTNPLTSQGYETLPAPEIRDVPLAYNFLWDTTRIMEGARRNQTLTASDVPDRQTSMLLFEDIKRFAHIRRLNILEVDCDLNNASEENVHKIKTETEAVKGFMKDNSDKGQGERGIVVIRDLERLVGANNPNPAQICAYNGLRSILTGRDRSLIVAISKTKPDEADRSPRMKILFDSFASRHLFLGYTDDQNLEVPKPFEVDLEQEQPVAA